MFWSAVRTASKESAALSEKFTVAQTGPSHLRYCLDMMPGQQLRQRTG
jgi:hypothetical protein